MPSFPAKPWTITVRQLLGHLGGIRHYETEDEINADDLTGAQKVGVTAGASTPNWLIEKIVKHLEDIGHEQNAGLKP